MSVPNKAIMIAPMSLRNELENSGSWLFRHRTWLPLAIIPIFFVGLSTFTYLGQAHSYFWMEYY